MSFSSFGGLGFLGCRRKEDAVSCRCKALPGALPGFLNWVFLWVWLARMAGLLKLVVMSLEQELILEMMNLCFVLPFSCGLVFSCGYCSFSLVAKCAPNY